MYDKRNRCIRWYTREDFHMESKELWKKFEKTGNIVDYLNYKSLYGGEYKDYYTSDSEAGEKAVESECNSNGNGAVRDTYR